MTSNTAPQLEIVRNDVESVNNGVGRVEDGAEHPCKLARLRRQTGVGEMSASGLGRGAAHRAAGVE